mgnify:CR=1 FL=1
MKKGKDPGRNVNQSTKPIVVTLLVVGQTEEMKTKTHIRIRNQESRFSSFIFILWNDVRNGG